jgi:hypothetical protein
VADIPRQSKAIGDDPAIVTVTDSLRDALDAASPASLDEAAALLAPRQSISVYDSVARDGRGNTELVEWAECLI